MYKAQFHIIVQFFQIVFVFESALLPQNKELGDHLVQHGDGVKDVAFEVDDVVSITEFAKKNGAKIVQDVTEESDEHGTVKYSVVQTVNIFYFYLFEIRFSVRRHSSHVDRKKELQGAVFARI